MPQQPQNKYDSGPAIVPVLHSSGELHHIEVPEPDIPLAEFHDALGDAGYHFDIPQPTKEGAIEYSEPFKQAARMAVMRSRDFQGGETGFVVGKSGGTVPVGRSAAEAAMPGAKDNEMAMPDAPWIFATLHTHPDRFGAKPSDKDIAASMKTGKPYFIASREGLFMVRPSDGKIFQVFDKRDWFEQKNPGDKNPGDKNPK